MFSPCDIGTSCTLLAVGTCEGGGLFNCEGIASSE